MMAWQQSKHLYLGSSSSPFCCSCCCYAIHLAHGQLSHVLFPHEKLQPEISSSGPGSADSGHSSRASTIPLPLPTTVCRCPTGVHYRPTAFLLQANGCLAFRPPKLGPPTRIIFRYSPISSPLCTSSFTFWLMWEHYFLLPLLLYLYFCCCWPVA